MKNPILLIAVTCLFLTHSLTAQSPDFYQYKWTSDPDKIISDSTYNALILDKYSTTDLKAGNYTNIRALKLIGTNFTAFPEVFRNNLNLERLIMVGNSRLNKLEGIQTLSGLKFLMLELNEKSKLPVQLDQLTELKYVVLSSSDGLRTDVPPEFFTLPNIEHLRISSFRNVPDELANFDQLIDLSIYSVHTLPVTLGKIERLETLRLSLVPNIPSSIGALKINLLELVECKIGTLPPEIGQMANLQTLILNENYIASLPSEIRNLKQLKTLKIKSRENFEWEKAIELIAGLPELESLDMNGSLGLRKLPDAMKNLDQINQLKISSTEYNHEAQRDYINWDEAFELFAGMASLNALHLGGNNIGSIPEAARKLKIDTLVLRADFSFKIDHLDNLANVGLKYLDLSYSNLTVLPAEIGKIKTLQNLDLYRCKLAALPDEMAMLDNLKILSLGNQQMDDIGNSGAYTLIVLPEVLFKMKNLEQLILTGNPKLSPVDIHNLQKELSKCEIKL